MGKHKNIQKYTSKSWEQSFTDLYLGTAQLWVQMEMHK